MEAAGICAPKYPSSPYVAAEAQQEGLFFMSENLLAKFRTSVPRRGVLF
jgi:hypothetical protein